MNDVSTAVRQYRYVFHREMSHPHPNVVGLDYVRLRVVVELYLRVRSLVSSS